MILRVLLLLIGLLPTVHAHRAADAFIRIQISETNILARWDIAVVDLDYSIELDTNDDGSITLGEFESKDRLIRIYAMTHLDWELDGEQKEFEATRVYVSKFTDGNYASIEFDYPLKAEPLSLRLCYKAFADVDPLHRSYVTVHYSSNETTGVVSPPSPCLDFNLKSMTPWGQAVSFFKEGNWHIFTGYDHVLFLIALLLPTVVLRNNVGTWIPVTSFKPSVISTVKVVTAFTLAHSITLGLATMRWVELPSKAVEITIAISVALAALNNLYPIIQDKGWSFAFGFGLIHGFGFAGIMLELTSNSRSILANLLSFNLGVETGQLLIVSVFLPFAFALRHHWIYQGLCIRVGSVLILLLSLLWILERTLEIEVLNLKL